MIDKISGYEFADFGCSNGGSIQQAKKLFDARDGIGIDISPVKVARAKERGFNAIVGDLTNLDVPDDSFRFVTMVHFLEHLPSFEHAAKCIYTGVRAANEFVYISQPWFASDRFLEKLGLKQYWSDWSGHTNHMDLADFYLALRCIPKKWSWRIYGRYPIVDSKHSSIHPLNSPRDQHEFDPEIHPVKPNIIFRENVFKETVCLIYRPDIDADRTMSAVSSLTLLLSSESMSV